MGCFRHPVEIGDWHAERFERVDALVDTGASYSMLPTPLLERMDVTPIKRMWFRVADGGRIRRKLGYTWIRVDGQLAITLIVFAETDNTPLLGSHALESLGMGVDPVNKRLFEIDELLL